MKKFFVDNLSDVADAMCFDITEDNYEDVMFAGYYEDAIVVLKHLLMFDETTPYHIDIADVDLYGYEKEYFITLDSKKNVWCEKAYDYENSRYLVSDTNRLYIADECDFALINYLICSQDEMYSVSYSSNDERECDDKAEYCSTNTEEDTREIVTRVATDRDGKLKGFEKSWETFEDGLHYHSTYSFYSSNENVLKNMLEKFNIKY